MQAKFSGAVSKPPKFCPMLEVISMDIRGFNAVRKSKTFLLVMLLFFLNIGLRLIVTDLFCSINAICSKYQVGKTKTWTILPAFLFTGWVDVPLTRRDVMIPVLSSFKTNLNSILKHAVEGNSENVISTHLQMHQKRKILVSVGTF